MQGVDCLPEFFISTIPLESDADMAKTEERVASLETSLCLIKRTLSVLVPTLLLWGWYITTNVIAMKQSMTDGGNTKLVAELKSPKSPDQLQANLATVDAQIQTARANGTKPNIKKVDALSGALSQVVKNDPDLPEAWQAAVQLVNYKYQPQVTIARPLPSCLSLSGPGTISFMGPISPGDPVRLTFVLHNCTLNLDDENFWLTQMGKGIHDAMDTHPASYSIILIVHNSNITYSGGKFLPVNQIQFQNCSFELKQPTVLPNRNVQLVTEQLLAANATDGILNITSTAKHS
jgi:hypothetical protein